MKPISLNVFLMVTVLCAPMTATAVQGAPSRPAEQGFLLDGQTASAKQTSGDAPLPSHPNLDASVPLGDRLTSPPDAVLQRLRAQVGSAITVHRLSVEERAKVDSVLRLLPDFSRQALEQHVRSISFLEGLPTNGITLKEDDSSEPTFNIVLRTDILSETISQFLTRKERNCYLDSNSGTTVSVEAGSLPALVYVLLHETVHIRDISIRAGQVGPPQISAASDTHRLVEGIWSNATTPAETYREPLLLSAWFRTGKRESIEVAEARYRALAGTPFVSLYGSSNWYDDIAELVTCYYLTHNLRQPYRIVLAKGPSTYYSLQPMDSPLVAKRIAMVEPLFRQ